MSPTYVDVSLERELVKPSEDAPFKWREAFHYRPTASLVNALRLALRLRQPLLLTGAPGCGKTSAAYWAALNLGLDPTALIHHTVRSDDSAQRIRYEFDAVKYFYLAQVKRQEPDPAACIKHGPLWRAFEGAHARRTVLLLDEVDKAPRDFPNDLLHEFDLREFTVPELYDEVSKRDHVVSARGAPEAHGLALLVVTSNGERQLPDAFLRRCLHHHVEMTPEAMKAVVRRRREHGALQLSEAFGDLAVEKFVALQSRHDLEHPIGLAEFLVWLRAVSELGGVSEESLRRLDLERLPYLEALLKTPGDLQRVQRAAR
jgi:MoxR-like ATPase